MSAKRGLFVVLVASAVMLAVGIGPRVAGRAQASLPVQEPEPAGATIPYPGRLSGEVGQPVSDGAYAFAFTLYGAESGGEPLWSEVQEGVPVQGGAFTALLGSVHSIPSEALEADRSWLEVAVRGPGEASFTALTPRQRLSAASPASPASPSAGAACPHDHWGETWSGTGGNVGLSVGSAGGYALEGWSSGNIGVLGVSTGGTIMIPSGMTGLHGIGDNYGVVGEGGHGAWFSGYDDHQDLILGGSVGRSNTSPWDANSQLYLSSNGDVTIKLDNDSGGGGANVLYIRSRGHLVCSIDDGGNLNCTGLKSAVVETTDYGTRKLYAMESPEVWFEDFGTSSLVDGEITVACDPIFAETVNLEEEYHVFVTPLGEEPVLLFVTDKDATAFTVRGVTLDGKPAACSFDYRIVAKRLGYEDVRLEETTRQEGE